MGVDMRPQPLLSICIPTYNRPDELWNALKILSHQICGLSDELQNKIHCFVSDNHSNHDASDIVSEFASNISIELEIQPNNIGPTLNFEYCFQRATGDYVLILSDDDHLTEGSIADILDCLLERNPDILFLPFSPLPESEIKTISLERNTFLAHVEMLPTLISSCIFRRKLIAEVFGRYLDTNMHHYHYFLHAVEYGMRFETFCRQILISPYEHNSGGYNWFSVFGDQLFRIIDEFEAYNIDRKILNTIERELLLRRIIPTFINRRVHGITISHKFEEDSVDNIAKIISKRCRRFLAYWLIFLPIYLVPENLLRVTKKIYNRKNQIFKVKQR